MSKFKIFTLMILGILTAAPRVLIPIFIGIIVDKYVSVKDPTINILIVVFSVLFSLLITRSLLVLLQHRILGYAHADRLSHLQRKQYRKVQKLKVKHFDNKNTGYYFTRLGSDSEQTANYEVTNVFNIYIISVGIIGTIITLIVVNWLLGLIAIGVTILALLLMIIVRKTIKKLYKKAMKHFDILNTNVANSLEGIREIKNFNAYTLEQNTFNELAEVNALHWRTVHKRMMLQMRIFFTIEITATILIVSVGSLMIRQGSLTNGALIAILSMVARISHPILKLLDSLWLIMQGKVSKNRINELLELSEETLKGEPINVSRGAVEFRNVTLKYNNELTALDNVNIKIEPGQKVAIVGRTGSGKSTLLKALLKHYPITSGEILIDNKNVLKHGTNSIRDSITYISQDVYLTNESIKSNILFTHDNFDHEKYDRAIRLSEASFIKSLPEQDETIVGPNGIKLSGGQKQRISIARGLFKETNIVLFDESTSALDNITEKKIQKNINEWIKGKTTITIAHRLSTIEGSDLVIVMDRGKVIEQGTYHELIERKNHFYNMLNK